MEYHIDRRTVFIPDTETSLYGWCLREIDGNGNSIAGDLIPWGFSLRFEARDLLLLDAISVSDQVYKDAGQPKTELQQIIIGTLTPSLLPQNRYRSPHFSMLGSGRKISNFQLHISPQTQPEANATCSAWGSVSYDYEHDFYIETEEDTVVFYYFIPQELFIRISERLASNKIKSLRLRVSSVQGFYSNWSPSITAENIKVLANIKDQQIEFPEGADHSMVRALGKVSDATLEINSNWTSTSVPINAGNTLEDEADEEDKDIEEFRKMNAIDYSSKKSREKTEIDDEKKDLQLKQITNMVRNFGWLLVLMLALLMLK